MASMRKRYVDRIEAGPRQDESPVTSPPVSAAKLPDAVEPKAAESLAVENPDPVKKAEKDAIALQLRLQEMNRADELQRQAAQQPPQAAEPQQQPQPPSLDDMIAHLPERVQRWYRNDPELATNPEKAAKVQYCHHVAAREVGEQFSDPYYARMEQMLGLAPRGNGQAAQQRPPVSAAPRHEAPARQPQRNIPMSAPPTRETPSFSTGRSPSRRLPLTKDELEVARASGISAEQYQENKDKMLKMKMSGEIQDGR
jgi:hypothetical protein